MPTTVPRGCRAGVVKVWVTWLLRVRTVAAACVLTSGLFVAGSGAAIVFADSGSGHGEEVTARLLTRQAVAGQRLLWDLVPSGARR